MSRTSLLVKLINRFSSCQLRILQSGVLFCQTFFLPQICRSLFDAVSTRHVLQKAREFCRVYFNFPAQWLRLVLFFSECQNKGSAFNFAFNKCYFQGIWLQLLAKYIRFSMFEEPQF